MRRRPRRPSLAQIALAAGSLLLFAGVLRRVPLDQVGATLRGLALWQIIVLLALNALIVLSFSGRWWLILRALGQHVPYLSLSAHRLGAFGVSYFTPGTQFGGEPLQVYLIDQGHAVPLSAAITSVTLDKTIELLVNFSVLAAGVIILLLAQGTILPVILPGLAAHGALAFSALLLAVPAAFLAAVWAGARPVGRSVALISRLLGSADGPRQGWRARLAPAVLRAGEALSAVDELATAFFRHHPRAVVLALIISIVSWMGMLAEYWLMAGFLGARLTLLQAILALTAARVAFLLPLPGGLGALEASQALAMSALGFDAALGVSLALLIRGRDMLFGVIGLGWAAAEIRRLRSSEKRCKVAPHHEPSNE
jgi:uncharacterized protein (TIRG00374 family)